MMLEEEEAVFTVFDGGELPDRASGDGHRSREPSKTLPSHSIEEPIVEGEQGMTRAQHTFVVTRAVGVHLPVSPLFAGLRLLGLGGRLPGRHRDAFRF